MPGILLEYLLVVYAWNTAEILVVYAWNTTGVLTSGICLEYC